MSNPPLDGEHGAFLGRRGGVNDTAKTILSSTKMGEAKVTVSTVFTVASILKGSTFISGLP